MKEGTEVLRLDMKGYGCSVDFFMNANHRKKNKTCLSGLGVQNRTVDFTPGSQVLNQGMRMHFSLRNLTRSRMGCVMRECVPITRTFPKASGPEKL